MSKDLININNRAVLTFEPRDLWVGIYWTVADYYVPPMLFVYVCLVPCFPVRFAFQLKGQQP